MPDSAHGDTDKELADLERRIASVYRKAASEMEQTVNDYFSLFTKRDAEMREWVDEGRMSKTEYTQWRLAQMGRGQRFQTMRDALAERYVEADEVAMAYINDDMAKVYALNRNYTVTDVREQAGGALEGINFTRYDEYTVKRLLVEQPDLMPYYPQEKAVARGIDLEYGKQQITAAVTSGILQGKSIGQIANDLQNHVETMSRESAVRSARTAMTEAENAGRQDAAEELEDMGVILGKEWIATDDDRTREAHAEADGQQVELDEPFTVGGEQLMFPGDGSLGASGWNLYNCRCSRKTIVMGFKSTLPEELQGRITVT